MLGLLHVSILFQPYLFPFLLSFHQIQCARWNKLWDKTIFFLLLNLLTHLRESLAWTMQSGSCWPEAHIEKAPGL